MVPPGKSLCEEGWKWSLISKFSCSAPPAFPKHLLWARSCGIHAGKQECSPSPPTTASKPLHFALCLLWDAAGRVSAFPELLYFPAELHRCDACRELEAFQLDGSLGENRNLSGAAQGKREQSPSPGTGCRAASETETVPACVPKPQSHCQPHSEGTHRTGPHCNQAQPAPPALPEERSTPRP